MKTGELISLIFIAACFLAVFCAIISREKQEFNYFKTWKW